MLATALRDGQSTLTAFLPIFRSNSGRRRRNCVVCATLGCLHGRSTMPFEDLPESAMLSVVLALDYKSVVRMKAVSKRWWCLISPNQIFWRRKFEMDFGEIDASHLDVENEYKLEYGLRFNEPRVNVVRGHPLCHMVVQFCGSMMVSGCSDHRVQVWDVESMECVHNIRAHDTVASVALDDVHVFAALDTGDICMWSLETVELRWRWKAGQFVWVICLYQGQLLSWDRAQLVRAWDMSKVECRLTLELECSRMYQRPINGEIIIKVQDALHVHHMEDGLLHTFEIAEVVDDACCNSKYLFAGLSKGCIQVWDKETKELVATLDVGELNGFMILTCGERYVVSVTLSDHMKIWAFGEWTCIRDYQLKVRSGISSIDCQRGKFVIGDYNGTTHVLDFGC